MPVTTYNFAEPYLRGQTLRESMLRSIADRERMEQIAAREEEDALFRELELRERLRASGARPVVNGTVEEETAASLPMDYQVANPLTGGLDARSASFDMPTSTLRKADKKRGTVAFKRLGEEYELATPEEQFRRRAQMEDAAAAAETERLIERLLTEAGVKQGIAEQARKRQMDAEGVDADLTALFGDLVSDGTGLTGQGPLRRRVLPGELDELVRASTARAKPAKTIQSSHITEDNDGKQVNVITYSDGSVEEKPLTARGKGARTGLTPGEQMTQQRFDENQRDELRKERTAQIKQYQDKVDELQRQKDAIAKENEEAGAKLRAGVKGKNKEAEAAELSARIRVNNARFAQIDQQQRAYQAIKNGLYGGGQAPADGGTAPAQAAPEKGDRRSYQGHVYEFDGAQWVLAAAAR